MSDYSRSERIGTAIQRELSELIPQLKDPRLGMVLPCRITVLEQPDGEVLLVAMNLDRVLPLFNNDRLRALFRDMQETQQAIFDEVTM